MIIAKAPGHGGSALKNANCRLLNGVAKVSSPASIHEEQIIGGVASEFDGKRSVHTLVYGYANDFFVYFDEALPLIPRGRDPGLEKFWAYMNLALDRFGNNILEKRPTKETTGLSYPARMSPIFILQLERIPGWFMTRGPLRRFPGFVLQSSDREKLEINRRRLTEQPPSEEVLKEIQRYFRNLTALKSIRPIYVDGVVERIQRDLEGFLQRTRDHPSEAIRRYGRMMDTTYPELLLKLTVQIAIDDAVFGKTVYDPPLNFEPEPEPSGPTVPSNLELPVTLAHLEMAEQHLSVFMESAFEFIDLLVDSSDAATIATQQDRDALRFLRDRGCVAEEKSTLSIQEYETELSKLFGCSFSSAVRFYRRLRENGLVDSKQIGSHGSRVWLTSSGLHFLESAGTDSPSFF